ncbi:MAG TPA: hypothetical protein VG406_05445 [Isosphaeraceae bacterium]|jgi:hypothetical protein|nr:hypothetical protein [Isosphaeraceae bacterium]
MKLGSLLACALVIPLATVCPAAEPEGRWITFVSHRSGRNLLYKMRPDGSELSVIFGGELEGMPGLPEGLTLYREPHWGRQSPDGRFFLDWAADVGLPLEKYNAPMRFMIYLGRLDGGRVRTLIPDGGEMFAWSPDSKRIAYSVISGRGHSDVGGLTPGAPSTKIFTVGVDGSNEELVLEKPGIWNVQDWSPDGKKLLLGYISAHSLAYASYSLHEFDLEASQRTKKEAGAKDYTFGLFYPSSQQIDAHLRLLSGSAQVVGGRYSPDGKLIAVEFKPERDAYNSSFQLGILDPADLKLRPILKAPGLRGPICWSPAGREILSSRWLDPQDDAKERMEGEHGLGIYAVRPDGSRVRFLATGWSPDWR